MENNIRIESKYRVKALFDDTSSVNDVLVSYYLPLIEVEAFAFYNFLVTESKNVAITTVFISVDRIVEMLNYSLEDIDDAISRLELVNLLEVLADDKGNLIFCLNKPLTPEQFNDSFQMRELLSTKIGSTNVEINNRLFNSLRAATNSEFRSVTQESEINLKIDGVQEATLNISFDFESIKNVITSKHIDWSEFWDHELESELKNILIVYKIDSLNMAMEIIDEYAKGDFNHSRLINSIRDNYPKKSELDVDLFSAERKLDILKGMSINDYFVNRVERIPTAKELKMIVKLKENFGLSDYMIIILIDYSIIVNNGAIVEPYITKIANTILKNGITTPEGLTKHLKVAFNMKTKGTTSVGVNANKEMDDKPVF